MVRLAVGVAGEPTAIIWVHQRRLRVIPEPIRYAEVVKATFVPFPALPYSWDALAAGITLAAGIVLPLAYRRCGAGLSAD